MHSIIAGNRNRALVLFATHISGDAQKRRKHSFFAFFSQFSQYIFFQALYHFTSSPIVELRRLKTHPCGNYKI